MNERAHARNMNGHGRVTTRIRGLLQNAFEVDVGVLSRDEALSLLLASADMDEAAVVGGVRGSQYEGGAELRSALEIVEVSESVSESVSHRSVGRSVGRSASPWNYCSRS